LIAVRTFFAWLGLVMGWWMGTSALAHAPASPTVVKIEQAELTSRAGTRLVSLPHMLSAADFEPEGSTVVYKLRIPLAEKPQTSVGIYVPKLALSGSVHVNGHFYAACERGALSELRCLHRPYLFDPPAPLWKPGDNELSFLIHASARQTNGLSSVLVGDVATLDKYFYRLRHWLQVDLISGLTWLSTLLGVLAIAAGLLIRKGAVYLWFGLATLTNALANSGVFLSRQLFDGDWFNWFVFASRFMSAPLVLLMFISFFDKLKPWIRNTVLGYAAAGLVLIALSDNSRSVVVPLYVPLILMGLFMTVLMLRWTWQSRQAKHVAATGSIILLWVASGHDWLRLTGMAAFEGMYMIPYAYSGVLFLYGGLLLSLLAYHLMQSQELSVHLEARMAERTDELNKIHQQLMATEIARSKSQERERMLQDMHDGFGSQLVTAKIMVEQNKMSQESLAQLLHECISDLYLVVDTLGNNENYLSNAFIDFRFRTQQRLMGHETQLHWDLQLEKAPDTSQQVVLQILRITQEALNNALKHAKARNIWISAIYKPRNRLLNVSVYDDGEGMSAAPASGRGKNSMLTRARIIGAELNLTNRQIGTLMSLNVPLESLALPQTGTNHSEPAGR
jgi:signal transduction histidine kinase